MSRNQLPSELAEVADANFITHAGWLQRRLPGMTVKDEPDLVVIDSGLPCDTFNFICRARLDESDALERAKAAVAYFEQVERPFAWWVGPADRPAILGDLLVEAGLERAETERAMSVELSELRSADLGPADLAPHGLRVRRVGTEQELRAFARLNAGNWTPPDPHVLRFYELASAALLADDCPLWLYLGYLGDVPVATGELAIGGGVVGLYNISTLAAHRRRGFGTAITLQPLIDARDRGFQRAILQAAPEGVSIYERVGFRTFGDITEYKPPADPEAA